MPIGEAAARKVAARLARYSVSPEEYAAWKAKREAPDPPSGRRVTEIRVEGTRRVNPEVIVATMETQPGEPIDQDVLDRDLRRIYGRGDFEHVGYRVIDEQSKRILVVEAAEKSWGPNYMRFGLGLSSDFQGETYFNLLARYRSTWLNHLGGELRADAQIGNPNLLSGEFYQPLVPNAYFFVAPYASLQLYPVNLFTDGVKIAQYNVTSAGGGIDLGGQFTKYGELRLGAMAGQLRFNLDSGGLFFPRNATVQQGAFTGKLYVDQLDSLRFPRSGYAANAKVFASRSLLGADDQYTKWTVDAVGAASVGRHSLALGLKAGGRIGDDLIPFYDQFQWGGFLQMSGYRTGEILAQQLRFGRLVYTYKLADIPLLEGVYAGASFEASNLTQPAIPGSPSGLLKSGSAFIALDSPIGPVYFAYGKAFDGQAPSSFYFFLGIP